MLKTIRYFHRALLFLFMGMVNGFGAVIYVDGTVTATSSTYNPATRTTGSGTATAYKTIAAASAVAVPGTMVLVRGGTYPESLSPTISGTVSNYVTFRSFTNEVVYLKGSTAITLNSRNYIVIDGFHAEDTLWLEAQNSHHNVLQNCVFKRTPATGTTGNVRFVQSNFNLVLNNDIEVGNDNLLFIDSNNNLAEGNTIKEGRHSLFGIRCGDGNVIRGNYFSNTLQKIGEVYDCGADTSAVPNSFASTSRNVIEDNIFAGTVKYYSSSGGNGIQYSGQRGIIRFNVFYNCNIGLGMQVYADEALYNSDNRVYHNTFYNNAGAGISSGSATARNIFKNNILFANQGSVPDCFAVSPGQLIYRRNLGVSVLYDSNDIFYQTAGQAVIEDEFNSGATVAQAGVLFPGALTNTLEFDPQFVDATNFNFNLKATSPLVDKGTFLTQTKTAGSGTVVPVLDASYFFDGWGKPGEGDVVRLQGQTQSVVVVALDLVSNTVTIDRPLTWTAGQGFTIGYSGAAPEVGAYELTGDVSAPAVSIISPAPNSTVSGTTMVSANASDDVSVVGVQFLLDGAALGAEVQAAPFQISWDTTKASNGSHQLTAVARDASGRSTTSTAVPATINNPTVPAPPGAAQITTSSSTVSPPSALVTLQWSPVADATSYRIKRATSLTGTWTLVSPDVTGLSFTDTVAATVTTYYYIVSAVNVVGESQPSPPASSCPRSPAPRWSEGIALSSNEIILGWGDGTRDEDGFILEIAPNGGAWVVNATLPPNTCSMTCGKLKPATTYWFRVRAYKGSTYSAYSSAIGIKTFP